MCKFRVPVILSITVIFTPSDPLWKLHFSWVCLSSGYVKWTYSDWKVSKLVAGHTHLGPICSLNSMFESLNAGKVSIWYVHPLWQEVALSARKKEKSNSYWVGNQQRCSQHLKGFEQTSDVMRFTFSSTPPDPSILSCYSLLPRPLLSTTTFSSSSLTFFSSIIHSFSTSQNIRDSVWFSSGIILQYLEHLTWTLQKAP